MRDIFMSRLPCGECKDIGTEGVYAPSVLVSNSELQKFLAHHFGSGSQARQ